MMPKLKPTETSDKPLHLNKQHQSRSSNQKKHLRRHGHGRTSQCPGHLQNPQRLTSRWLQLHKSHRTTIVPGPLQVQVLLQVKPLAPSVKLLVLLSILTANSGSSSRLLQLRKRRNRTSSLIRTINTSRWILALWTLSQCSAQSQWRQSESLHQRSMVISTR